MTTTETQIGIWLDKREAWIYSMSTKQFDLVQANLDTGSVKGGSGMATPYGPQDVVSESKMLAREQQQLKHYYQKIMSKIDEASHIVVMGPSQTKLEFKKFLEEQHAFRQSHISTQNSDNLTEAQFIAKVKDIFDPSHA